ncbi:MAG: hypothetical protein K9J25_09940 [Bacteroidales bacterium]|nr:hypothetical protein [Bacteroidales bacterium]
MNKLLLLVFAVTVSIASCSEDKYADPVDIRLSFSADTLNFDTVFTEIGTITKELRVVNPGKSSILINQIGLGGAGNSPFRLNVDGEPGVIFEDIEIAPGDSIFIFVDARIDPTNEDYPLLVRDSIEFRLKGNYFDVNLIAWGQDVIIVNNEVLETQTWAGEKPYLVYESAIIDTGHVLTIAAGSHVFFHRNAKMVVAGTVIVNGTLDNPVVFKSDRTEKAYMDVPGQWQGIVLNNGSTDNYFRNTVITNAVTGIVAGQVQNEGIPPEVDLENVNISHMSVSGLSASGATVRAGNLLIAHCGYYCAYLVAGGSYTFNHCSFANRWEYSNRITPSLYISDFVYFNERLISGNLSNADFTNSVVSGQHNSEILVESLTGNDIPVSLINCLVTDTSPVGYSYENTIFNADPLFTDWSEYDFRPDTLSPLINSGDIVYAEIVPFDIRGYSRLADPGPDIGAYERIPGEDADNK